MMLLLLEKLIFEPAIRQSLSGCVCIEQYNSSLIKLSTYHPRQKIQIKIKVDFPFMTLYKNIDPRATKVVEQDHCYGTAKSLYITPSRFKHLFPV